jgi:hypothetical protein
VGGKFVRAGRERQHDVDGCIGYGRSIYSAADSSRTCGARVRRVAAACRLLTRLREAEVMGDGRWADSDHSVVN